MHLTAIVVDFEFCVSTDGERIVPYQIGACSLEQNTTFERVMHMDEAARPCVTAPEVDAAWLRSRGAVDKRVAMREFVAWLWDQPNAQSGFLLLAHNAFSADAFLLASLLRQADVAMPFCHVFDTLAFCRHAFRGRTRDFSQNALAQLFLNSNAQTHSAAADATELAALLRYARTRQHLSGIAMPLGAVPVTCEQHVGPATAASMMQHGVPIEVCGFAAYVRAHDWPPVLQARHCESLQSVVDEPPTADAMLARLARQLSI